MTELFLDTIETELFKIGLDFKREYDQYDDHDVINIICGEQHIILSPLWSVPTSGDDDAYFFDSDDIRATLYLYGEQDGDVDLFPESSEELATLVQRIFDQGVDSLEEVA